MKKKPAKKREMSVYANLVHKRKVKKDSTAKKRAEYLATLPKHPVKRFFYRMHPKRVFKFWFSKRGFFLGLKIFGVAVLIGMLFVGGVFAYFRKDIDQIRPDEIAKRVQTNVSRYYDRNDKLLWEDKGGGNYKLVVKSEDINEYMKQATIAIEDRDFYNHHGVSLAGIMRAAINNTTSETIQGGSTLTQQLVKQVFFADQAGERSMSGIPRKIKEAILAIEVERMYNKDEILTLYLNESPYGGPRNGVESAAQAYFGKKAKDLTLAEASLLASIPQNPSVYDPYNIDGNERLIAKQHNVLDAMVKTDAITQDQADKAKKVAILDTLQKQSSADANMKAPHFVYMVRSELVDKLGASTVGKGGFSIKTTLDLRIQNKLEAEVKEFFKSGLPASQNISNTAATVEDTQSGQIVAMVGSRDFRYPGFGEDNAADAFIQPGSTIKPFVYAELFKDKGDGQQNFGSGSILRDENIDQIYGTKLNNWDDRFMGNLTIRRGLALSRNTPAVKAMYVNGVQETLDAIHSYGAPSYCTQEMANGVGLSSAIGSCGIKQIELVNAFATIGRLGTYRPTTTVLEVKNNSGEVIDKWKKSGKQVMDPQIAYIISDILSDPIARTSLHGPYPPGLTINGVKTAGKTGTSDRGGRAKDLWIVNYGPSLSMALWLGNSDTSTLGTVNSVFGGRIVSNTLEYAYKDVYAKEKKWKEGQWLKRPDGIKQQGVELYPSWWDKSQGQSRVKLTFDKLSKKKATKCTPAGAKIELEVIKTIDPISKKDIFIAPDGYDASSDDDKHKCGDDNGLSVQIVAYDKDTGMLTITSSRGRFPISRIEIRAGGAVVGTASGSTTTINIGSQSDDASLSATIYDQGLYQKQSAVFTVTSD